MISLTMNMTNLLKIRSNHLISRKLIYVLQNKDMQIQKYERKINELTSNRNYRLDKARIIHLHINNKIIKIKIIAISKIKKINTSII